MASGPIVVLANGLLLRNPQLAFGPGPVRCWKPGEYGLGGSSKYISSPARDETKSNAFSRKKRSTGFDMAIDWPNCVQCYTSPGQVRLVSAPHRAYQVI